MQTLWSTFERQSWNSEIARGEIVVPLDGWNKKRSDTDLRVHRALRVETGVERERNTREREVDAYNGGLDKTYEDREVLEKAVYTEEA